MKDEIINKLIEYVDQSKDFILEQAPGIIQEILTYEKWHSILSTIMFLLLFSISASLSIYHIMHPIYDKHEQRTLFSQMMCFIPLFVSPLLFVGLCYNIEAVLKIYMAPKWYILELLINLKG